MTESLPFDIVVYRHRYELTAWDEDSKKGTRIYVTTAPWSTTPFTVVVDLLIFLLVDGLETSQ